MKRIFLEQFEVEDEMLKEIEKDYFENERSKVKALENDFIKEFTRENPDLVKKVRLEFLENKLKEINKKYLHWIDLVNLCVGWFGVVMHKTCAVPLKKEWDKVYREIDMYKNPRVINSDNSSISEEDIEMARNANCAQFVDVKKRVNGKAWALCVFHEEKTPSLCCYEGGKGFFCYGCGVGGDSITLVRKLHGLGFRDAVNFINNNK